MRFDRRHLGHWSIGYFLSVVILCFEIKPVQAQEVEFKNWEFMPINGKTWMPAQAPGSIYLDLLRNKQIEDPFFNDQEKNLRWVDTTTWVYEARFHCLTELCKHKQIDLVFEGLDTYVDIYLNGECIGKTDNMFRRWVFPITEKVKRDKRNKLTLVFHPAKTVTEKKASEWLPMVYPDNARVHARKSGYQFGWDWGPTLIGAGIWKAVRLIAYDNKSPLEIKQRNLDEAYSKLKPALTHHQDADSIGRSFYFKENGKPKYMQGANWIPLNMFPGTATKADYRKWLLLAKESGMNMLRVWGGGIYESDDFYDLCDSLGIYVWQDLMFACAMYPADKKMMENIREEVRQQVMRLRHHPCLSIWCGNNEIDEAWKNWGWQKSFNLSEKDATQLSAEYKTMFEDSLRSWINTWDPKRAYISTSPSIGWGHVESYTHGDSHFWGMWWGKQDWQAFYDHTGRFVSEYGMQSVSDMHIWKKYLSETDPSPTHPSFQWHQKANEGFNKLHHYLDRYMLDSNQRKKLNLEDYIFATQCMQAFVLENVIQVHRSKFPNNMGTLLWQLNDAWPAISWSIANVDATPKLAWYAVKRAYAGAAVDSTSPQNMHLQNPELEIRSINGNQLCIYAKNEARFVTVIAEDPNIRYSDNGFRMQAGETKYIEFKHMENKSIQPSFRLKSWYDVIDTTTKQ